MDSNGQFPQQPTIQPTAQQDHDSRASKITFFLKIIIVLLIPLVFIKIFLLLTDKTQQAPQTSIEVSVTPSLTQEPTAQPNAQQSQSAPTLTQALLDEWSKKLESGSETDFRSIVELPENQKLPLGALQVLSSQAPFHFKLETFKKNADNTSGTISVDVGKQNKKKTISASLRVINGTWKIVKVDTSSL